MNQSSFVDVWELALSVFAQQTVFIKVAIGLGAALVVVMCLEGFYASFFPRRYAARLARNYHDDLPPPPSSGRREAAAIDRSTGEVSARISALLSHRALQQNRKLHDVPARAFGFVKPKIQRRGLVNAPPETASRSF